MSLNFSADYFLTHDAGLAAHWRKGSGATSQHVLASVDGLLSVKAAEPSIVWIDMGIPQGVRWKDPVWQAVLTHENWRCIASSSNPKDEEGMAALDAGCVGYCHSFSDARILQQIRQVVADGQVWIGRELMQRLLSNVRLVTSRQNKPDTTWSEGLTSREVEVAVLAANGSSNQVIAIECNISERTVKAHLSAVFTKLNISDRLQLALRVHGVN